MPLRKTKETAEERDKRLKKRKAQAQGLLSIFGGGLAASAARGLSQGPGSRLKPAKKKKQ